MKPTALVLSALALFSSCTSAGPDIKRLRNSLNVPALEDLESWLADREAQVSGLKPGVQAGIVWADPGQKQKTEFAIFYLPGYTATRGEIDPVVDRIGKALGANVFYARPTGQGVGPEGHRSVTADDWVRDGMEAYEIGLRLGTRVVVVGTSTGGTVATWLTLGPAQWRPAATILVSPNLTPRNRSSEMLLWPGASLLVSLIMGNSVVVEPQNDLQAQYWDTTHHSHSFIPMMQLVSLARSQDFSRWPSPVLVVFDPEDSVVDPQVTARLFSQVPEDLRQLWTWQAAEGDHHHVLAGSALSPGGTDRMVEGGVEFLKRMLKLP